MQPLPAPDFYQRAILNPNICFSDSELKGGKTYTNKRGLATVWSGQFASVFRLQTVSGTRAIRCFTSKLSDQQDRYARLHLHIDSSGKKTLPMLAAFEYQANGMLVNGVWYPIVKMEWVNGEKLDEYVEKLITARDTKKMNLLAIQWLNLFIGLQQNHIAHGDLQHENILISNGYIRLVDYDGVYVPDLSGRIALEIGHPHYQHPNRTISDFNLGIDNFSVLVIYLSLKALASDPSLWTKYHKDKHLIFRNVDFKSPSTSLLFASLKSSKNMKVRNLASALASSCIASVSSVPNLNSLISSAPPPPSTANWRSSWTGMEPVVLPKTPVYTPPPTTYTPPQWKTSTLPFPNSSKNTSRPTTSVSSPSKTTSLKPFVIMLVALGLFILGIFVVSAINTQNSRSIQNAQFTQAAIVKRRTATAIAQSRTATAIHNHNAQATKTAIASRKTATAAAQSVVVYSENFSSATEWEWDNDTDVKYVVESGKLKGEVIGQIVAWTFAGKSFEDIRIDVDVNKISGSDNNEMGIICNATDNRHFYAFGIGSDQTYEIWRQDGDDSTVLAEWESSSKINSGTKNNHLVAICSGGNLSLLVNGSELVSVYDKTYKKGDVGVFVGSFEDNTVSVFFDNFNVSNP